MMQESNPVEKIVAMHGATLYDIEIANEFDEQIYRVYITAKEGVTLDMCADISGDLSVYYDVHPPLSGKYRLEVSSPGLERKLSKKSHFQHAIGEKVKVKILGEGKSKGVLVEADEKGIAIETKEGIERYEYGQLGTVKTYFEF